jgi:hypothetical protein
MRDEFPDTEPAQFRQDKVTEEMAERQLAAEKRAVQGASPTCGCRALLISSTIPKDSEAVVDASACQYQIMVEAITDAKEERERWNQIAGRVSIKLREAEAEITRQRAPFLIAALERLCLVYEDGWHPEDEDNPESLKDARDAAWFQAEAALKRSKP